MATVATAQYDLLNQYENLVLKRSTLAEQQNQLARELQKVEEEIDTVRASIRSALSMATSPLERPSPPATVNVDDVRFGKLDPRVQKNLQNLFKAMDRLGSSEATATKIGALLKITPEAARQRLIRAVELGYVKRASSGNYIRA